MALPAHTVSHSNVIALIAQSALVAGDCVIAGTADGTCTISTTAGEVPIGVAIDPAASGDPASIATVGSVAQARAKAAIAIGVEVSLDNENGECHTAVAGEPILGTSISAAAAENDLCSVIITLGGEKNA